MFRFTIRDVLWLTVVVGMGCAWGAEYFVSDRRWTEFKAETLEQAFQSRGYVVEENWPSSLMVRKGRPSESDFSIYGRYADPPIDQKAPPDKN